MSDRNVIEGYSVCSACSIEEQMRLAPNSNWSVTIPPHSGGPDCRLRRRD